MPSIQGPVQGRFKPTHDTAELVAGLPISLSTKVPPCVRRFETPTSLSDGRAPKKKTSLCSAPWFPLRIVIRPREMDRGPYLFKKLKCYHNSYLSRLRAMMSFSISVVPS